MRGLSGEDSTFCDLRGGEFNFLWYKKKVGLGAISKKSREKLFMGSFSVRLRWRGCSCLFLFGHGGLRVHPHSSPRCLMRYLSLSGMNINSGMLGEEGRQIDTYLR